MKNEISTILLKQVEYVKTRSEFYKRKYQEYGNRYLDFFSLPFTTKTELLIDQHNTSPFGSNLCVREEEIIRVHKTSGTTNKPLIIALTLNDINTTIKVGSQCFKSAGLRKDDLVVHCLNYNMWAGGYTDHQSLEMTGAAVIPFGVGNSHNLIETILLLRPTAIHCTPSYLKKLELIIRNDFQLEPDKLGIRLGLFGAESGLQNPIFRHNIEGTWGLKAMNANYGLSDVLSIFGAECQYQRGLHFFGTDVIYPELIKPQTLESIEIQTDAVGELVLSNLVKESQPLLRYRTNDVIKILSIDKCKCGCKGFTFEIVGRSDDMIVIKGINVFLSTIESVLSKFSDLNVGIFQVHVNKIDPINDVHIYAEVNNKNVNYENLKNLIVQKFQSDLCFKPDIYLLNEGELKRCEGKTKKLYKSL
jgi:phenylacetate-CoA ligase